MSTLLAYVTTALNENEALAAMVLGESIKQKSSNSNIRLCCLVLPHNVSQSSTKSLSRVFDQVINISYEEDIPANRQDLIQVICEDLFERNELSAAPDTRWPDHFNTGVFVFSPNLDTYKALVKRIVNDPDIQCPILGSTTTDVSSTTNAVHYILNSFFSGWAHEDILKHLPFIYNVTPNIFYTYQPALHNFKETLKIIQFTSPKPWDTKFDVNSNSVSDVQPSQQALYTQWWSIFNTHVTPILVSEKLNYVHLYQCISTATGQQLGLQHQQQSQAHQTESGTIQNRRDDWERGNVDYMGKDSFDNIKEALDKSMNH